MKRILSIFLVLTIFFSLFPCCFGESAEADSTASELTDEQLNSIVMLNYLTFLTQEINSSNNSRLFLEEVYSSLINNTNSKAIDEETQEYLSGLLEVLEAYRMIDVKRERLEYIYEQNKAQALRDAVPNPLGLLSAVNSFSMKKLVTSIVYMAVDSVTSYQTSSSEADLEYLKDGWELDDSEAQTLHNSRVNLFNFIITTSRKHHLPDEMTLREPEVEELVKYENNKNVMQRIQFLEANQETYKAFGEYWLILAKSYYEKESYSKCLKAISEYEKLNIGIFRKDHEYAEVLPLAISALEESATEKKYLDLAPQYAKLIKDNTNNDDWALRYFAAQTYINLYAKTKDEAYLKSAYDLALNNVNNLVSYQKALNDKYLADLETREVPKNASKEEKREINQYNNLLYSIRRAELPPIYEPLILNCDLLFALAGQLDINSHEKSKINDILRENGSPLFLSKPIENTYMFEVGGSVVAPEIGFDGSILSIPAQYLSSNSKIKVTVFNPDSAVIDDWEINKVDRNKGNDVSNFVATFKSQAIKKYPYTFDSIVQIDIIPYESIDCETVSISFKVDEIKKIGLFNSYSFSKVE